MWNVVAESVIGTSHIDGETPCQDACRCDRVRTEQGEFLIAVCSDGAGSATYSQVGAAVVCDQFLALVRGFLQDCELTIDLDPNVAREWGDRLRDELDQHAAALGVPVRELACTLLGAVVGPDCTLFVQVGDGAMVVADGDDCRVVFWPQSGEYANTTNFLTQDELDEVLQVAIEPTWFTEFAAFTDGLERLVLRFAERTVHRPFLGPLWETLRSANEGTSLGEPLRAFLASDRINDRTNDDKTLILATRVLSCRDVDSPC